MLRLALLLLCASALAPGRAAGGSRAELLQAAQTAEQRFDLRRALDLYLAAESAGPPDAALFQKIARQYSDLALEQPTRDERRAYAQHALDYSRRAVELEPRNAVNVLSIAIAYGKLALASDTRDKVRYSRLVREETERALNLDPNYAWAHHVLAVWHEEVSEIGGLTRALVKLVYGGLPDASPAKAVDHLERAVTLEPDELQHHLELGRAYLKIGDTPRARAALERGLAMPSRSRIDDPAKARAREALAKLK